MADKETAAAFIAAAVLMLLALWAPPSEASGKVRTVMLRNNGLSTMEQNAGAVFTAEARHAFKQNAVAHHEALLEEVSSKFGSQAKMVHSYTHLISGFAAVLTDEQVEYLKDHSDVHTVQNDGKLKLHTTYTPSFLKLNDAKKGIWKKTVGRDSIIGVFDSGVWPEHVSFSDAGFGPVPSKFKGICDIGNGTDGFKCNKKLIGARVIGDARAAETNQTLAEYLNSCGEYSSPRDKQSHGTAVSSVATGVHSAITVGGGSLATARGVAYGARLVVYKVIFCEGIGSNADLGSAIELAVKDGVDVISISLGTDDPLQNGYVVTDIVYAMAYAATQAGVPVVFSAGNAYGAQFTVSNGAPWVLTVGAGTVDRNLEVTAVLGNGAPYSLVATSGLFGYIAQTGAGSPQNLLPLINSANAALFPADPTNATLCFPGSLDPGKVNGTIVVCTRGVIPLVYKTEAAASAGGLGCIIVNSILSGPITTDNPYVIPTVLLSYEDGLSIQGYINTTEYPTAYITPFTQVTGKKVVRAPAVSYSSSLGPNLDSLSILKPNVFAPGENIVVAVIPGGGSLGNFAINTGSSYSAPHASGAIALLAILHPSWTPSMLFSALSTTATRTDNQNRHILTSANVSATPFEMGSGQINPDAASDPGLVYAIPHEKYSEYLCSEDSGINYFKNFFNVSTACSKGYPSTKAIDLNLPSVTFFNISVGYRSITKRTLTNVGSTAATYILTAVHPPTVKLSIFPTKLYIKPKESRIYNITVQPIQPSSTAQGAYITNITSITLFWTFGSITWSDGKGHMVRIPLSVNAQ